MTVQKSARRQLDPFGSIDPAADERRSSLDRSLQRCAMWSMMTAMLVMALGLPLHITSLGAHPTHRAGLGTFGVVWSSALLTLVTLWIARHVLGETWRRLRRRWFNGNDLVVAGAIAALIASLPALRDHAAPMYFDVSAMALAWIVAGQAQEAEIRRRFDAIGAQLAPLNIQPPLVALPATPRRIERGAILVGAVGLGFANATFALHLLWGYSVLKSGLAALATIAAACPCTLGIVASSADAAGAERAATAGWLIPSGLVLRHPTILEESAAALPLGAAKPEALRAIMRTARRAVRWNYLWAVGFNLASLPFALAGPVPALVPAANMLSAWLLIALTNRTIRA